MLHKHAIIIALYLPVMVFAQLKPDSSKRVNYLAIPIVFRTPETGWAYGLSGSANFKTTYRQDTFTRMSVITLLGMFSQRQQNVQGLDATIYFPKETYIFYGQVSHSYFPDKFWGIGQLTKNDNEEKYVFEHINLLLHLKRKAFKNIFFGWMADYQNILKTNYTLGGVFDASAFLGKTNYQVTGIGCSASYDTRTSAFWPTKGLFAQTQYLTYHQALSSSYTFHKWLTELRVFVPLAKRHILAVQLYNYLTIGDTPFRSLASLGGPGNLRGFYQGRFRDKSMCSAIMEYRAPLIWRVSACAFFGLGEVYQTFHHINTSALKHSFGGGLRISVLEKEKLHLRIDYGYADRYNNGFYFTVGECF